MPRRNPDPPEDNTIPGTMPTDSETERAEREMQEIVSTLKKDFEKRNELYEEYENAVFYQNGVTIPADYEATTIETRSPLPSHIVNTVTAALSSNYPKVQFQPVKGGDKGQENAELRSHFFEASMRRQEEESDNRWFRMFMSSLVMKGEGVLKTLERKRLAWSDYNAHTRKLTAKLDDPDDEDYKDVVWKRDGYGRRSLDEDSRRRVLMAKTEEYKRGRPYPIITTHLLPETFYYQKTAEGISFAAEVKEIPYLDALERYGAALTPSGKVVVPAKEAMGLPRSEWHRAMEGVRTLTMYETWDHQYCHYWLAGPGQTSSGKEAARATLVKRIPHRYGDKARRVLRGPYFHSLGITTHSPLPDRAGLGILYGFLDLFKLLDSLLTIQSNSAFQTGFPAWAEDGSQGLRITAQAGDFGDDNATGTGSSSAAGMKVVPGRVMPAGVRPLDQPRPSIVIDKVMADVRGFIEYALPSVMSGLLSGDPSGYALNQAQYLASLALDPIVDNAEFALSRRTGFESWLIEDKKCIGETVYVWGEQPTSSLQRKRQAQAGWLAIGPDDLAGVHRYTVRLDPETPSNEVIKTRTLTEQIRERLITRDDAILDIGGNPEEVERWWQLEDFKRDPDIQQQIRDRAKEKLRIKQQQRLHASGEGGPAVPPGATGAPGTPPMPDVFMPGQNGMPLEPTPAGSVTGSGPRPSMGNPAGTPVVGAPPGGALPLPGQV